MDPNIARAARQIVENNLADDEDECDFERVSERITNMENTLKIIVDKLNVLVKKRQE